MPEDGQFNMQITKPMISGRYLTRYNHKINRITKSRKTGTKSMTQEALRKNIRQNLGHSDPEGEENSFRNVLNDINDISLVNKWRNRRNQPDTMIDGDLPEVDIELENQANIQGQSEDLAVKQLTSILKKRGFNLAEIKLPKPGEKLALGDVIQSSGLNKRSHTAGFRIK